MKDLGHLRYFLVLEVAYAQRGYLVSQQKYTSDILSRVCLTDTRTANRYYSYRATSPALFF